MRILADCIQSRFECDLELSGCRYRVVGSDGSFGSWTEAEMAEDLDFLMDYRSLQSVDIVQKD